MYKRARKIPYDKEAKKQDTDAAVFGRNIGSLHNTSSLMPATTRRAISDTFILYELMRWVLTKMDGTVNTRKSYKKVIVKI